jgi:multidrug transporter EmrE-like cation transporter
MYQIWVGCGHWGVLICSYVMFRQVADHSRGFEFSGAALFTTLVKGAGFDL